jgi:hypothetical protein
LLHDAAEAYVCDMPRPVKRDITGYKDIENRNEDAILLALIREKLPVDKVTKKIVKTADNILLATEQRDLMLKNSEGQSWDLPELPLDETLIPIIDPRRVEADFIHAYESGELPHEAY